jgi:3-hydroxymyristoyl/3-hydroxydecanoyl-(acyl carrier protein) dehydratase
MNLLKEHITNPEIIKKLIPQREPIIMVDSLLYFSENNVVSGLTISEDNIFVQQGYLTEPGIIEHMAQTVALYTGYHFYIENQVAPEGYIGAIKGVHIHKMPKIGDRIETEVEILQEIMGVTLVKGTTRLQDEIICTAEMKTVLKDNIK